VYKAVIDRIPQIDRGPVRIQRSHIAQRRKAVAHVTVARDAVPSALWLRSIEGFAVGD
jgi:hypothetical protein